MQMGLFILILSYLVIIKQTNSTNNWRIVDYKRDGYNGSTKVVFPSVSNAEGSEVGPDILSNGFKLKQIQELMQVVEHLYT